MTSARTSGDLLSGAGAASTAVRIELTKEALASLAPPEAAAERLLAEGAREVLVALPVPEAVPASFKNGVPAREDLPPVLDAVAPVARFLAAARARGLAARAAGFPRGVLDGRDPDPPITAMIEVSSRCNLRCPLCSVGRRALARWDDMPAAVFERIVADLAPSVRRLALHNLGEPLLHRELPRLVGIAKEAGIAQVFLSTNLAVDREDRVRALVRSGVDEIVVSMDAATPATYPVYRVGGELEVVLRNLAALVDERRQARAATGAATPRVRAQFLLFRHNEAERPAFRELARRFGIGFEVKVASAPKGEEERWLPASASLRRAEREPDHGWCPRPYAHTTILSDGTVVPCCKDADGKEALGNAAETPFLAIWQGEAYRAFRGRLLEAKASIPLCRACPGGWFRDAGVVEREEDPWPG